MARPRVPALPAVFQPRLPRVSVDDVINAGANAWDLYLGGGVAQVHPTDKAIVDEGPQRTVYRYLQRGWQPSHATPVLLVPPLAAPAWCFDLRRGCSLAEHLLARGYPTYVVDYGAISFSDRALGLEHWVDDVIPNAIEAVVRDSGRSEIQLVGWCLGGIMALLATAARDLPVRSVGLIASPFDFTRVRMMAPIRRLASLTGGALGTTLYRMLGGAPAPLVSLGFRATAVDRYVTKPVMLAQHMHDRDWLAHAEAVDQYMAKHARLPGPHLRPALPPVLPCQRACRRHARAGRPLHRARQRERARARGRGNLRRAGAGRRRAARRRAAAELAGCAARDGTRRSPRRADRAQRGALDLDLPRRVPRRLRRRPQGRQSEPA
jgi:hypothetical protein